MLAMVKTEFMGFAAWSDAGCNLLLSRPKDGEMAQRAFIRPKPESRNLNP